MPTPLTLPRAARRVPIRPDERAPRATRYPTSCTQNRRNSGLTAVTQATAETASIGDASSAVARGFGREVKPSIHFIETGDPVECRVASRLQDSGSSNPYRHSWQKIRRDARGDRSLYRTSIAVMHVANTSQATTSVGEEALHVASDVFESEDNSARLG
jgi:hypothetical protein